eukprot:TRINITY_DN9016_c0_g1_i1.p2 TRINITY_DN9016_c0_g1~~TRINITY_DN9016_c0_g1_i1.p2  ORF type:complete len:104 (+),score=8.27 TRINITY_DN9016_c0_g1_i1:68-379(+)
MEALLAVADRILLRMGNGGDPQRCKPGYQNSLIILNTSSLVLGKLTSSTNLQTLKKPSSIRYYHFEIVIFQNLLDKKYCLQCCLLYTSPSPRDLSTSRMPSSA